MLTQDFRRSSQQDIQLPSEERRNHLCRNDIRERSTNKDEKCKGCIICKQVKKVEFVTNNKSGTQVKTTSGATCQTKGVVYAVRCVKCDLIYVGNTGDSINIRFSKHKYDIKNRPEQNELTTHYMKYREVDDLIFLILDHVLNEINHGKRVEDNFICRLQMQPAA